MTASLLSDHPLLIGVLLGALALAVLALLVWLVRRDERGAAAAPGKADLLAAVRGADVRALNTSFTTTLRAMRGMMPGSGWRYAAPWVLMLGPSGSGKSALASSIGLTRPFDLTVDSELAEQGCAWHVFERGIVLDPAGCVLWGPDGDATGNDGGWRRLLQLLQRHRPERGLDGVVVTLPAGDLVGPDRLDAVALASRAKQLRRRLRELQQNLGLRLPVYLVVTKCDTVPGFTSFWEPLAVQRRNEVFGWSNPQTLETTFAPHLLNEAFDEIGRELHRTLIGTAVSSGGLSDMAFLFPAEFQKLSAPVARFATALFRLDSYQDPHFFRGLYFTGDGSALVAGGRGLPAAYEAGAELPVGLAPAPSAAPAAQPLFATELFSEKIFRESRLVRAARRGLVARSRTLRFAQAGVAAAAVVLSLGLWYSYTSLQGTTANIIKPLMMIEKTDAQVHRAREAGQSLSEGLYRDVHGATAPILNSFKTLSDRALLEPFIPTSWFSTIEADVKHAMAHGFGLVVLYPMRLELIKRWDAIQKKYGPQPQGQAPEGLAAQARVQAYLGDLDALAADIQQFNTATDLPVLTFSKLVTSLLGINLGEALLSDAGLYRDVMRVAKVKPFDASRNIMPSLQTLARLGQGAVTLVSPDGPIVQRFAAVASALERAELARFGAPDAAGATLVDLNTAIDRVQTVLGNPDLRWLFVAHPENEPHWKDQIQRVRANLFLGETAAQAMLRMATTRIADLRAALLAIRTPGTGPLLVADETDDGLLKLAPAVDGLAAVLPDILKYEFMADTPVREPVLPSRTSTATLWSPEPLARAMAYYKAFEAMEAGPLTRVPDSLRPMVQALAAQRLQTAMLTSVAQAQVVEQRGQDFRMVADETGLLREVRQFGKASRSLGDILGAFSRRGMDQAYATVSGIVAQHVVSMLEQADRIGDEGAPYLPVDEFKQWDGTLPLNFEGFQVLSDSELAQYLDNTRGRFDWLGTEVAAPLVNFALREQTPNTLRQDPHVLKWQRILIEQQRYKADNPASSLALLERYVRFDLGAVKPDTCLQQLASGTSAGGDFFQQRRDTLRRMALAQCQRVAVKALSTDYTRLATDFNAMLAGRYPFADYGGADTAEADLDAVVAFLERFGNAEAAIRRGLGTPQPGTPAAQALAFIDNLAAVKEFLAPFLAATSTAPPAFDVAAEFRVNRPKESGGNQIIEWLVAIGDQQMLRGSGTQAGKWSPGDPVTVTLRWAKDAPVVPVSIVGADGSVQPDRSIGFAYMNRWSLVRLLQVHRAPAADLPKLTDSRPHTLKFSADTTSAPVPGDPGPAKPPVAGKTSVFLRLGLSTPTPDGKGRTTFTLPSFPYGAPRLDTAARAASAAGEPFSGDVSTAPVPRMAAAKAAAKTAAVIPPTPPAAKNAPTRITK
ncbi:type VI secretion protein IcmF/TssM N-terminal domain-containing protein [Azospirillum sp.]|uniref:type VI secretion protein IcmF/TssM N-terminal domain-containing protein n=1 Tax=Azospirillum sp. TaxID=34012 RepID=UPI003D720DD5